MPRLMLMVIGTICLVQSGYLILLSMVGIGQYFNIIDLLQGKPLLVLTKILYYADPDYVTRVNIGTAIDSMPDQAFVLITGTNTPALVLRTLIFNILYLSFGVVWFIDSTIIVSQLAIQGTISVAVRVTWLGATILIFITDLSAFIVYASDYFYTQTLEDLISVSGHVLSGNGNVSYNTKMVSWFMVFLLTRGAIMILINFIFFICLLTHIGKKKIVTPATSVTSTTPVSEVKDIEEPGIPRVHLNPPPVVWSLRQNPTSDRRRSLSEVEEGYTDSRTIVAAQNVETEKKTTINFPENLLSLPQRLENMIAEQQKKLDSTVIDTSGRRVVENGTRATQSLPQLTETSESSSVGVHYNKSRRSTATGLQGQLPWSYIPPPAHRMRDQLPPDEELPPVPVPDYTIHPSYRKASVHRAGSNISHIQEKKEHQLSRMKGVWRYMKNRS